MRNEQGPKVGDLNFPADNCLLNSASNCDQSTGLTQ